MGLQKDTRGLSSWSLFLGPRGLQVSRKRPSIQHTLVKEFIDGRYSELLTGSRSLTPSEFCKGSCSTSGTGSFDRTHFIHILWHHRRLDFLSGAHIWSPSDRLSKFVNCVLWWRLTIAYFHLGDRGVGPCMDDSDGMRVQRGAGRSPAGFFAGAKKIGQTPQNV